MSAAFKWLTRATLSWLVASALYQFLLSLVSLRAPTVDNADHVEPLDTVILVPAHDEERVIGACLRSYASNDRR